MRGGRGGAGPRRSEPGGGSGTGRRKRKREAEAEAGPWPGLVILELSKEKPGERLLERQAAQFSAAVLKVEAELSAQIRYLTQVATGQPHEGSTYGARKSCQMALNRLDYARLKLGDVARACEQLLEA